ncbi:MAG: PAS domain S-box protein [Firmicutes bacterium]|nr:PAS domain S-box protein [Bacillota bacterium]
MQNQGLAIKNMERMHRLLFETLPNPIFFKDAAGLYLGCNKAFEDFVGLTKEEIVNKSADDLWPPDIAEKAEAMDSELLERNSVQIYETVLPHADGTLHDVIVKKASYINDGQGTVDGIVGTVIDITPNKRKEIMLQNTCENYRAIFHSASDAIILHDPASGDIVAANKRAAQLFGCDDKELRGLSLADIFADVPPYTYFEGLQLIRKSAHNEPQLVEWLCRKKSNQFFWVETNLQSVVIKNKLYVMAMARDITERKNKEQELAQLDRLHLIGQMAAAIGHEVRNPMTTVRGFLQLFGAKPQLAVYKEYFDVMIDELDRANDIIKQFLLLSKDKDVKKRMVNLNTILETVFPLIQADASHSRIKVNMQLRDIPELLLDEKEIKQLIFNLVHNGLEAMEKKHTLTISTFMADDKAVLAVADQGSGISAEILPQLGTPFLTTKDERAGLGLAVCYSIAARHNAKIDVETNVGRTVFNVRFKL